MSGWQKIYSTEQYYNAELIKNYLEEHDFKPVIINKRDSSYNNFGLFEVHVIYDDVMRALHLIKNDIDFK